MYFYNIIITTNWSIKHRKTLISLPFHFVIEFPKSWADKMPNISSQKALFSFSLPSLLDAKQYSSKFQERTKFAMWTTLFQGTVVLYNCFVLGLSWIRTSFKLELSVKIIFYLRPFILLPFIFLTKYFFCIVIMYCLVLFRISL